MKSILCNKKKLFIGAAIILVLAIAFWYGGNSPGPKGWPESSDSHESNDSSYSELSGSDEKQTTDAQAANQKTKEDEAETTQVANNSSQASSMDNKSAEASKQPEGNKPTTSNKLAAEGSPIQGSTGSTGATSAADSKTPDSVSPSPGNSATQAAASGESSASKTTSCTISINCKTILNNMDSLKANKVSIVPSDGWILKPVNVELGNEDTVFDVLLATTKKYGIHMEYSKSPVYDSIYIEGIANLYEFDCGDLSGWMYKVNGSIPDYGCSLYTLKTGDTIEWVYTCDLGKDMGGGETAGN